MRNKEMSRPRALLRHRRVNRAGKMRAYSIEAFHEMVGEYNPNGARKYANMHAS